MQSTKGMQMLIAFGDGDCGLLGKVITLMLANLMGKKIILTIEDYLKVHNIYLKIT